MSLKVDMINYLVLEDEHRKELFKNPKGPDTEFTELPKNVDDWPEHWYENYEERAAIMEYDGGLKRTEAESQAEQRVRAAHKQLHVNSCKEIK